MRRVYTEIGKLSEEDISYDLQEYSIKHSFKLHGEKQPKVGEYWMCHLKQGAWNRITVLYRPTDEMWDLPYEQLGVKWEQEDVTPLNRMMEEK